MTVHIQVVQMETTDMVDKNMIIFWTRATQPNSAENWTTDSVAIHSQLKKQAVRYNIFMCAQKLMIWPA